MAHELGHVQMNHSNDLISQLQTSGLGRLPGALALTIGAAAGGLGADIGNRYGRGPYGCCFRCGIGEVGGSGNFIYE